MDQLDAYMREVGRYPGLTADEEARLAREVMVPGSDSLDRLVRAHLSWVIDVAGDYPDLKASLGDLINEGNFGLIRAACQYGSFLDEEQRGRSQRLAYRPFRHFAERWVRDAIEALPPPPPPDDGPGPLVA
jgi:hypothetical protein